MEVKRPGSGKVWEGCGKYKLSAPLTQDNHVFETSPLGDRQYFSEKTVSQERKKKGFWGQISLGIPPYSNFSFCLT